MYLMYYAERGTISCFMKCGIYLLVFYLAIEVISVTLLEFMVMRDGIYLISL